jgi:hypothetical protein
MGKKLLSLINLLKKDHFPNTPASQEEIDSALNRIEYPIPPALLEIWKNMNGVCLFDPIDPPYRLLEIEEFLSVNDLFRSGNELTSKWFVFCDILDGNYVSLDLSTARGNNVECRDIFHEMFPDITYCKIIANSVEEFVSNAVNSQGRHFWLHR